ncbi:MAG: VWA domain-containing protein [Pirellulaceae bacterium]|nr:VWA domain-containing protein [Pirellulaceae bacterium]
MNQKSARENSLVSVTNGSEFLLIPYAELDQVQAEGYYRPSERGLTIVSDGKQLLEVPIAKVEATEHPDFSDVLARERSVTAQPDDRLAPRKPEAASTKVQRSQAPADREPASDTLKTKAGSSKPVSSATILESKATSSVVALKFVASNAVAIDRPEQEWKYRFSINEYIERSVQEAELARLERERKIDELTGWNQFVFIVKLWFQDQRAHFWRKIRTGGISAAIHLAMLLILASFFIVNRPPNVFSIVASINDSADLVEEATLELQPTEITEPSESSAAEAAPAEESATEILQPTTTPNFMAAVSRPSIQTPAVSGKGIDGTAKTMGKPTVFGSNLSGTNFVFVIDNSNSMTGGRFETALLQLILTVNQLTPKQRFYVIFYSDTAYGMLHPNTVRTLAPATPQNKNTLGRWLNTVPLCLKTNGKEAIEKAIMLNPDVIYVLGDGAFTDKAAEYFSRKPHPTIVIHTRGMEVKKTDADGFKKLAESHRGTYKDVGVMPEGAAMAKEFPRPRNNTRGTIWGITLPLEKKK